jgi:hypothetical protein
MNTWVAGYNMSGYLPEMEPQEFDEYSDAVNYILDVLLEWNDMNALNYDGDGLYSEDEYLSTVSIIEGQRVNGAEIYATFDRHSFWVRPVTN